LERNITKIGGGEGRSSPEHSDKNKQQYHFDGRNAWKIMLQTASLQNLWSKVISRHLSNITKEKNLIKFKSVINNLQTRQFTSR
jgi:hypothetical protein